MTSPKEILEKWLDDNYDAKKGEMKPGVSEDEFDVVVSVHGYLVGSGESGWRPGVREAMKTGDAVEIARAIINRM